MQHQKIHFKYLPVAIMILGFLITEFVASKYKKFTEHHEQEHFAAITEKLQGEITRRMSQFNSGLRGTAALWPVSRDVTRAEFAEVVGSRDLETEFNGALGIGFIRRVNREDLDTFLAETRADGAPDFTIKTSGNHPNLYIVEYISPVGINQPAIGFDIGQEANRRSAVEKSMLTGKPVITAPIHLVQITGEGPGFLLLYPVYKNSSMPANEAEREENLIGWTYMPIVASRVLKGATTYVDNELDFEVFHGDRLTPDHLIYDNDGHLEFSGKTSYSSKDYQDRHFQSSKKIDIGGTEWTLVTSVNDQFHHSSRTGFYTALIGGITVTLLVSALVATLGRSTRRAYDIADEITLELQETLKEVEMLAMVATRTTNAVIICDENRCITWVNEGFTRITGFTLEESLGKSPGKLLQSESSDQKTIEAMRESLNKGEPIHCEIINRSKSGHDYWMDINIVPVYDDEKILTGFMSVQLDISERKKNEQAIREEAERTSIALTAGGLGFWDWNVVTGYTVFDERWAAMLGEKVEDMLPQVDEWIKRCHPDDYIIAKQALQKHFDGEVPMYVCRYRVRHRDGSWRWIVDSGKVVLRGANGEVLRVVGAYRDVTHEHNAQLEAERLIAALNHTGKLAKVGSWQLAIADQSVYWSDQVKRIHEVDDSFVPNSNDGFTFFPPEAAEKIRSLVDKAIREGTSYDVELPFITAKGNKRWVRAMGEPLQVDGVTTVLRGAFQDITEAYLQRIALAEAKKVAEQASQAKADFLANMSHEIRSPMNAVIGMTELLQQTPLNKEQEDFVGVIRSSGENLLVLINDILDFSKIDSGNLELEQIPVHLRECVEKSVEIIAHTASEKDLDLVIAIDPDIPVAIYADRIRLNQILINLLANAVKFTSSGQIVISLSCTNSIHDRSKERILHFAISDTGIGIPEDRLDRLFKSFSQVDTSTTRQYGGTGLGLAICARLIDLMKGRIWVESIPGKGSTFHFEIPVNEAPWSPESVSEGLSTLTTTDQPLLATLKPLRILITEDLIINQRVAKLLLERLGYTAEIADNGKDALHLLEQQSFDVIFMDVQMPVMDGLACTREICHIYPAKDRPWIIAMTAKAQEGDRQICLDAGMDDYISKPINKSVITKALLKASEGLIVRRTEN